jgi:hypothetical protein
LVRHFKQEKAVRMSLQAAVILPQGKLDEAS